MNLIARLMGALGWPAPAVTVPARPRRLRATCELCGKELAIIASTGQLWPHRCERAAPSAAAPTDGIDEVRALEPGGPDA